MKTITEQIKWWKKDGHFNIDLYLKVYALKQRERLSTSSRIKDRVCELSDNIHQPDNQFGH